jgi:hypothetical protein
LDLSRSLWISLRFFSILRLFRYLANLGTVRFEDVIRLIHPYQEELRREINPHVYTAAELKRKARENSSFIARILKLPKISVIGDPDELGKLG